MKKLICLTLATCLLLSLVACRLKESTPPDGTVANTTQAPVTTAPPVSVEPPAKVPGMRLAYAEREYRYDFEMPTGDGKWYYESYESWLNYRLKTRWPSTRSLDYEPLYTYCGAAEKWDEFQVSATALITSREELDLYFAYAFTDEAFSGARAQYARLLEVDFSKHAVLIHGLRLEAKVDVKLEDVTVGEDAVYLKLNGTVEPDSAGKDVTAWTCVLLLDVDTLPERLNFYEVTEYDRPIPNVQTVEGVPQVRLPYRFVEFVPVA